MRKGESPLPGDERGSSANSTRVFGVPLDEVTRTHTSGGYEVPVLVKNIVEYIQEHGDVGVAGLFLVNGNAERVEWLRQRLDGGEEEVLLTDGDLSSAVSLLRLFLQQLPEPLITPAVQAHILLLHQEYSSEEELLRRLKFLLQQLPPVNFDLLRFLCRFLVGVASLQDSWTVGSLAAVFGPDIFHLSEGEELQEQEAVSRVLAELLDKQDGLFHSDDELSTPDYSSVSEQITELLDDDKCEDLPQDEDSSPQPCPTEDIHTHSTHLSPISILPPDSAQIIQQTIRAAVEQHFMKTQEQDLSKCTTHRVIASEEGGCHGDKDQQTQTEDVCEAGNGESSNNQQDSADSPDEGTRMDYDQNNINTSRQDNHRGTIEICCDLDSCECDHNANNTHTNRKYLSPCQSYSAPCLQLFTDNQWEDPVPAFKSWPEESESGEAQLSPLAGRMVRLPPLVLPVVGEEDGEEEEEGEEGLSHPSSRSHTHILARRFIDFGAAQKFHTQDPGNTSPTKAHRPRRASLGSKEAVRGDSVTHQLTKKLQHLKKKIRQFEEQFEKERNFKPSHGDKAANPKVLKWMTDMTKIRRQIKDTKQRAETELGPHTRPRSNTLPKSFGSTLDQHDPSSSSTSYAGPSRQETLDLIQKRVRAQRTDNTPEDIKKMTKEQLSSEKTVLQKNLLHYEGLHGRPVTREERLVMKPLYDRYRLVKQMLTRVSITPITVSPSSKRRSQTLQPIIEGETAHFWEEIEEEEEDERGGEEEQRGRAEEEEREEEPQEERDEGEREEEEEEEEEEEGESSGGETPSPDVIMTIHPISQSQHSTGPIREQEEGSQSIREQKEGSQPIRGELEEGSGKLAMDLRLSSSNASSMPELLGQLWKARAEKKQLRKTIRQFEEDFYQLNGRNVQKEDRLPMMEEYRQYKRLKAKLRLLEVLISKQDNSKSI